MQYTKNSVINILLSRKMVQILLAMLLIMAFVIRVKDASQYHYNPDEMGFIEMAEGASLAQVIHFSRYEVHPPFGNILRHYWIEVSHNETFIRAQSLLFGLVAIVLFYRIGMLLNGPLAGFFSAALCAFSPLCITQSYVVRNNIFFLCFSLLAFYNFLQWRKEHQNLCLYRYTLWGILACLTHFSGIFPVFCMAAYESFAMLVKGTPWRCRYGWAGANLMIAAVAINVYWLWQLRIASYPPFESHSNSIIFDYGINTLNISIGLIPSLIFLLYFLIIWDYSRRLGERFLSNIAAFRFSIQLFLFAFCLGAILAETNIYPYFGQRHSIWIIPFSIPVFGLLLADACRLADAHLTRAIRAKSPTFLPAIAIVLCLILLACNSTLRYNDISEYLIREKDWRDVQKQLDTLNGNSAVILEKDSSTLLRNVYPYLQQNAFIPKIMATSIPYGNTRLIINPYYSSFYSDEIFLKTIAQAQSLHMLDQVNTLVFLVTYYSPTALKKIASCTFSNKKIISFPKVPAGYLFTPSHFPLHGVLLILVNKEIFFKQVMSKDGKAYRCFNPVSIAQHAF